MERYDRIRGKARPNQTDSTAGVPKTEGRRTPCSSSDDTVHPNPRLVVPLLYIELLARDSILRVCGIEPQGGQTVQFIAQFRCKGSIVVLCRYEGKEIREKSKEIEGKAIRRRKRQRV